MTDFEPLSEFAARPEQTLSNHLEGVAAAGAQLVEGADETPYGDDWAEVMRTLSWVHDIGKLTEYFQEYLETGSRSAAPRAELTYHGSFGGFVAVLALAAQGMSKETAAAGFYAVTKHHSVLPDVRSNIGRYSLRKQGVTDRYTTATEQLENIDETASEAADLVLRQATDGAYTWDQFRSDGMDTARKALEDIRKSGFNREFYGCVLRAWSTLVTADKLDASGLTDESGIWSVNRPNPKALESALVNRWTTVELG